METVLLVILLIALGPEVQAGSLHRPETEIEKEDSLEFKTPDIPEGYDHAENIDSHEGMDLQSLWENASGAVVDTEYGPVEGTVETVNSKTIDVFKGIPFAAPPERFRKPKPPKSWTDTFQATRYGNPCLQLNNIGKEDCLYLNIWSPQSEGKDLPVMIWIYGGAFIIGASSLPLYDGAQTAARGNVVIVSFNYRLGPLGFLSTGDANAPGNYGLWDQHAAIAWVTRNIKAFGGNPNSITLFGQSAGAASVNFQILSPHNKGLIKRAISESGVANSPFALVNSPLFWAQKIAKTMDCPSTDTETMINCLRKVDAKILTMAMPFKLPLIPTIRSIIWAPVIDGDFIPKNPETMFSNAADVDYIVGVNNWDGLLSAMTDTHQFNRVTSQSFRNLIESVFPDKNSKAIDGVYDIYSQANGNLKTQSEIKHAIIDFETDLIFLVSTQATLNLHQKNAKNANTYSYMFSYANKREAASHGEEMPYVFGLPFSTPKTFSPTDRKISEYMIGYWTNFAQTGNPNKGGSAVPDLWQLYNSTDAYYLEINNPLNEKSVKQHLREDFVTFWTQTFPNL